MALIGAATAVGLLALTYFVSHYVGFVKRADVSILRGFAQLSHPRLQSVTSFVAGLCDPHTYVILCAVPLLVALRRHRPRVAVMIAVIILGANETTQLLKPLLAAARDPVYWNPISEASWPSGHATASMSLALCSVIAAPARYRPAVGAAMAAFAIAVCYSFLELGWHYPSDVLGGFLMATAWTLVGMAGLWTYEARRPAPRTPEPGAERVSIGRALMPAVVMILASGFGALLIVLARPHQVIDYARGHEAFVVGAAAIGALSVTLASGLSVMLRDRVAAPSEAGGGAL